MIIPAYNRAYTLNHCLFSLTRQTAPISDYEVIVVDHGSVDETRNITFMYEHLLNIRYIVCERNDFGAAIPRNKGIANAQGDILVFVDTDHILHPDFLVSHNRAYIETNADAVLGRIYGVGVSDEVWHRLIHSPQLKDIYTNIPENIFELLESEKEIDDPRSEFLEFISDDNYALADWPAFWTGNASMRRRTLNDVGYFCHDVKRIEDIEMGLRLAWNSKKVYFTKAAQNFHFPHPRNWQEDLAYARKDEVFLMRKYPCIQTEILATGYTDFRSLDVFRLFPIISNVLENRLWFHYNHDYQKLKQLQVEPTRSLLVGYSKSFRQMPIGLNILDPSLSNDEKILLRENGCEVIDQLGTKILVDDRYFDIVILNNYIEFFPEPIKSRLEHEIKRIAKKIVRYNEL